MHELGAYLPDAVVQPLLLVHERPGLTDPAADLLARHDVAGAGDKAGEHLDRLQPEPHRRTAAAGGAGPRRRVARRGPC